MKGLAAPSPGAPAAPKRVKLFGRIDETAGTPHFLARGRLTSVGPKPDDAAPNDPEGYDALE